jgi:predicted RNA-binding protein YlxR (DUF448 family)
MIRLYHGSNQKIEEPDLAHSKPFKDFGRGFYLSPDKQQAWDLAFQKVSQTQQGKAVVPLQTTVSPTSCDDTRAESSPCSGSSRN